MAKSRRFSKPTVPGCAARSERKERFPVSQELGALWQHLPGMCWGAQLVLGAAGGSWGCASLAGALCWLPLRGVLPRVLIRCWPRGVSGASCAAGEGSDILAPVTFRSVLSKEMSHSSGSSGREEKGIHDTALCYGNGRSSESSTFFSYKQ